MSSESRRNQDLIIPVANLVARTRGEVRIRGEELRWQFARSGGPGGQNVNKVASKAVLRWNPAGSPDLPPDFRQRLLTIAGPWLTDEGEILITSQRFRERPRNIEDCLQKLRSLLLTASHRPKQRKKTKPTRGSKERRLEDKRLQSRRKKLRRYRGE
jgi:ribosome-associated protein